MGRSYAPRLTRAGRPPRGRLRAHPQRRDPLPSRRRGGRAGHHPAAGLAELQGAARRRGAGPISLLEVRSVSVAFGVAACPVTSTADATPVTPQALRSAHNPFIKWFHDQWQSVAYTEEHDCEGILPVQGSTSQWTIPVKPAGARSIRFPLHRGCAAGGGASSRRSRFSDLPRPILTTSHWCIAPTTVALSSSTKQSEVRIDQWFDDALR